MSSEKLILFCGPSGSGKTTIVHHLLKTFPQLAFSVSATTREKRHSEHDGKDYYFLTPDEFRKKISKHEFVEWEEVYKNVYYGTLKSEIERIWKQNQAVVFDVDVEGGLNIKKKFGDKVLTVFVEPPSIDDLHHRIKARGTESTESFLKRVAKAEHEMTYADKFDRILTNDKLNHAIEEAEALVKEFLKS